MAPPLHTSLHKTSKRRFSPIEFTKAQRDAIAMERLTPSPHIIDVYGFCGLSALNEMANGSVVSFLQRKVLSPRRVLSLAVDAVLAVASVHGLDEGLPPTMVHRDINVKNFVISLDGSSLKLNDFNFATFLKWDARTKSRCGFLTRSVSPVRYRGHVIPEKNVFILIFEIADHHPFYFLKVSVIALTFSLFIVVESLMKYRSPEEIKRSFQTEKVDIYALANVFYFLLTGKEPYSNPHKVLNLTVGSTDLTEIHTSIINGDLPVLPSSILMSKDPAVVTIRNIMEACYSYEAEDRPDANVVVAQLQAAFKNGKK